MQHRPRHRLVLCFISPYSFPGPIRGIKKSPAPYLGQDLKPSCGTTQVHAKRPLVPRTFIRAARITGAGPVSGYGPNGLSPPPSEVHSPPCRAPWSHSSRLPLPRPVAVTPLPQRFDCVYHTPPKPHCQEGIRMFFACFFLCRLLSSGGKKRALRKF